MNTQTKLVLVFFPIFLVLLVVSLVLFIKAGKKRGRKIAAVLAGISVLLALGLTVGCVATAQFLKRDYIAQTQLSFEDSTVKVTVKEWEFLQGSGAEVYQTLKNGSEVHLGSLTYGDTIHPFKNGYFHATVENGKLQLTYTSKYNDTTGEPIRKTVSLELQPYDRFALPSWFVPVTVGFAGGAAVCTAALLTVFAVKKRKKQQPPQPDKTE